MDINDKRNLDNVSEVEDKAREAVNPDFAEASREIRNRDKLIKELQRVRRAPEAGKAALSDDIKLNLDENLFISAEANTLIEAVRDDTPLENLIKDVCDKVYDALYDSMSNYAQVLDDTLAGYVSVWCAEDDSSQLAEAAQSIEDCAKANAVSLLANHPDIDKIKDLIKSYDVISGKFNR